MIPVLTTVQIITESGQLETKGANSLTFYNTGGATLFINGVEILPGSFFEIKHNINEGDITDYSARFVDPDPANPQSRKLTLITTSYANRTE